MVDAQDQSYSVMEHAINRHFPDAFTRATLSK